MEKQLINQKILGRSRVVSNKAIIMTCLFELILYVIDGGTFSVNNIVGVIRPIAILICISCVY